nr:hypothetical protein [Tanacetum cinerariifolium]
MTSFGYRLNPRYAIKECSSCGALYTGVFCCSKGNVENKILVPELPKNCARYARCGHMVDGLYCQGCALLQKKLEEDLVTHFQDFQNTFESSDDSTNIVNAPREPFVVKQDHESLVDKIIYDLNKAPDSPNLHTFLSNQLHCFHCKDVLGDGEFCQRCTSTRCGSGLSKGLCLICGNNQNSLNDSPSISENSSQNPPHINKCCNEYGDALDGIFCQQCTCKSCGKGAHIDYNCPPKVPIISNPKPCNQTMNNEPPQTLPSFNPTCYSEKEISLPCVSKPNFVDESPKVFNPPPQPPVYSCEFCESNAQYVHYCTPQVLFIYPEPGYSQEFNFPQDFQQQYLCFDQTQPPQFPVIYPPPQETSIEILHDQENIINVVQTFLRKFNRISFFKTPKVLLLAWDSVFEIKDAFGNKQYKLEDIQELFRKLLNDLKNIHEELAEYINTPGCNPHAFYNDDDDDDVDCTIAITSVLSTEEPDNSISMGDEHLDTILTTKSDKVIKSSVEDLVPIPSESKGIPNTMCDVHLVNNSAPIKAKDHFEIVINSNDDNSSSDDDSLYNENIEYVEASPHDSKLVSLEVAEIVIPEDKEIEDDNLREKLLNVNLQIAKIKALKDNPTPSFEFLTKSSSTSPKSFLEETNTFDNSLPEFVNFCFDLEKISSGSTTTHSDISLLDYEAFYFYDDHIKEISSGSTTTHYDISLSEYDSFIFDLSENLPNPGEWISILNSEICENLSSTTRVNLPIEDDHSLLLEYVVWIFVAYLMYPVNPPYLHSFENKDTIFDPGIAINHFYSFKSSLSHRCGTFKKFNTHRSHLNESLIEMLFSTCFPMDQ